MSCPSEHPLLLSFGNITGQMTNSHLSNIVIVIQLRIPDQHGEQTL